MTGHKVTRLYLSPFRFFFCAKRLCNRATRAETTPRRRIHRRRHIAFQNEIKVYLFEYIGNIAILAVAILGLTANAQTETISLDASVFFASASHEPDSEELDKLATFATKAKIVHVDVDPAEIGKNRSVDVPIVGDAWIQIVAVPLAMHSIAVGVFVAGITDAISVLV